MRHENPHIFLDGLPLSRRNHEEDDVMGKLAKTNHRQSRRFYGVQSGIYGVSEKSPRLSHVPEEIPEEKAAMFLERLEHYRKLYQPVENQAKEV
jgi:hypothetical protein